jgi:hypothetical protein
MKLCRDVQAILHPVLSSYMTDNVVGLGVVASFMLRPLSSPKKFNVLPQDMRLGRTEMLSVCGGEEKNPCILGPPSILSNGTGDYIAGSKAAGA